MYDDDEMDFGYDSDEDYDDMDFGRKKKRKKCRKGKRGRKCRAARARRSRKYVIIRGRKRKLYRGKTGALYYRTRRGKTYIKGRRGRKSRFGESSDDQYFGARSTVCGPGQMMNPAWARGKKGTRPCIKTKIKVTRAMLQAIAAANGVNIYKLRRDGTPGNAMMSSQGLKYRLTKSGVDWRSQLGIPAVAGGGGGGYGPMPMPAGYVPPANPTDFTADTQLYAAAGMSPFIASPDYGPLRHYTFKNNGKQGSGYYLKKTGSAVPAVGAGAGPDYIPSGTFIGAQPGYAFRSGAQGQGYYYDD